MTTARMLTASDFQPLRDDPASMDGALDAVQAAIVAEHRGQIRQSRLVDRVPGEFEGIRLSLMAGDGLLSGMRVFGNPPHTRAFLLFDGVTRVLLAILDYGILNSMRVGATAGLAARYLAPPEARVMGLLGSGWQAQPQVYAMCRAVPSLERICVWSPTPEHREAFALNMTRRVGLPVQPVASAEEALRGADIVDLCAPGHFDVRQPLFEDSWVKPGALVISMAPNQYTAAFAQRSRLVAATDSTVDGVTPVGAVILNGGDPRQVAQENVIYHLEGGTVQDLFIGHLGLRMGSRARIGPAVRPVSLNSSPHSAGTEAYR